VEVALAEVGLPRIGVRVELDERHRPVHVRERTQLGKRDRVIAPEDEWEDARVDDRRERLLDLRVRSLGVAGRNWQVAVVHDRESLEKIDSEDGVKRAQ